MTLRSCPRPGIQPISGILASSEDRRVARATAHLASSFEINCVRAPDAMENWGCGDSGASSIHEPPGCLGMQHSSPSSSNAESPTSPGFANDLVSEKSAKIKRWVKNRLQELEEQNERLRAQNLKCSTQLKALTSCADKNRHWRKSNLFSHSISVSRSTSE
ncbi:hypothetical protein L596_011564 [Steinernema carpocapsae]|uniref:Uncharacterized protein n=1 Tax=Steinernema carpocapsae TaxID=34508 RepID=A0A4V6A4I6_STECR|nr:hypothetical protein L596_011564 [Steinernema carpocapsae]